ncbi:MAG: OsmC family protein [Myxococcales bacterium]|nr:OsmC family protein [Myxococcales bacterium]
MQDYLRNLRKPLLILHSPQDEIVGIEEARHIYEGAKHPKSFISLDGADHLLSKKEDSEYVATTLTAWAQRYLRRKAPHLDRNREVPEGKVQVETLTGPYAQAVTTGRHNFISDEPVKVGGDDAGPSPYDLLLAGLGSCTSMTLAMYARRKGWALTHVSVRLEHERMHAEDCAQCPETDGKVERITKRIALEGDLDAAQRQRLLEIADRCPVNRTLLGNPTIVGVLDEDEA